MIRILASLVVPVAVLATGCVATDSDNILTRGMYASMRATADGTGNTDVSATLFLGPPTDLVFIELTGGDQLIAHNGDRSRVMTETSILNIVGHHASFATDAEGEEFEVEFTRDVDDGAPSSHVTLPAPFTLGVVPPSVSRNAAFGVNWTSAGPSADPMAWSASGACIDAAGGSIIGDPGSVTMPAGTFRKAPGQNVPDSCGVTVTLTRTRDGDVDRAFEEGGSIEGLQVRSVTFTSTP